MIETDPLARGRARVERRAEGLRIEIAPKRDWALRAPIVVVLGIWAAAGVGEILDVARGDKVLSANLPLSSS